MSTNGSRPTFMGRGFVLQGDKTSHGGVVQTGFSNFDWNGIPVARLGDRVYCPRCKPHQHSITQVSGFMAHGVPIATDGDVTSCGAVLIAASASALELHAAVRALQFADGGQFDRFFRVADVNGQALSHQPYRIQMDDGRVYMGTTDDHGHTQKVFSDTAQKAILEVPFYGDSLGNIDAHDGHDVCSC